MAGARDHWRPTGSPSHNLGIELTTRCNSNCRRCFARAGLAQEASLTPARAKAIWAEGHALGYRHLHLTGGEPLLWPGLFELLAAVFAHGCRSVFLNSNGTLFTPQTVRRLARHEDLAVSVSLQGRATQHDRVRGSGSFRQARRGIRAALDAGLDVTIFMVVGKRLLTGLAALASRTYEEFAGITRLTLIQMIRVREDRHDASSQLLDPDDFLRLVRTVASLNLFGIKTDVLNNPLVNVAADLLQMPWIPPSQPLHRPGRLMIRANGNITLAHSTWESYGHYQPGMLGRVLASRQYRRAVAADVEICPACRFVDHCRSHGMLRPSDARVNLLPGKLYCREVLSRIPDP